MEYCIDTNVYIQASRTFYAFDIAPKFWLVLEKLAIDKIIVSPLAVYTELIRGDDELSIWAKNQKEQLFIEPDLMVSTTLREVADFSNEKYADAHQIRGFLSGADPWVIAQAKANNLIVVTMEKQKLIEEVDKKTNKIKGKIKIPNMCDHFGIRCINLYDFLRAKRINVG